MTKQITFFLFKISGKAIRRVAISGSGALAGRFSCAGSVCHRWGSFRDSSLSLCWHALAWHLHRHPTLASWDPSSRPKATVVTSSPAPVASCGTLEWTRSKPTTVREAKDPTDEDQTANEKIKTAKSFSHETFKVEHGILKRFSLSPREIVNIIVNFHTSQKKERCAPRGRRHLNPNIDGDHVTRSHQAS